MKTTPSLVVLLLASVAPLGCAEISVSDSSGPDAVDEHDGFAEFDAAALPPRLHRIALEQLSSVEQAGFAPHFARAKLGRVRAIDQVGVQGSAYYEVQVLVDGEPSGFLIVATGPHDVPVCHFNTSGPTPTDQLLEESAGAVARFVLADGEYRAESAGGTIVSSPARAVDVAAYFRDIEARMVDPSNEVGIHLRSAAQAAWASAATTEVEEGVAHRLRLLSDDATWSIGGDAADRVQAKLVERAGGEHALEIVVSEAKGQSPGAFTVQVTYAASGVTERLDFVAVGASKIPNAQALAGKSGGWCWTNGPATPLYNQLNPGELPNGSSCSSGCGPTAWAILIGWADLQAATGDPKWAPFRGLVRQGGAGSVNVPDTRAPDQFGWAAKMMIETLRKDTNSFCWAWGSTSTTIYQMRDADKWLSRVGLANYLDDETYDWGGSPADAIRDQGEQYICNSQTPAILGKGYSEHYYVGEQSWRSGNTVYFFVNYGWGGQNMGWFADPIFLAATLKPKGTPYPPPSPSGMEIFSGTFASNLNDGSKYGNKSPGLAAACNGLTSCSYPINVGLIGDPEPNKVKNFWAQWQCGGGPTVRSTIVGEWTNAVLTCPTVQVQSATYGGNCGAPQGNVTNHVKAVCNGRSQCAYEVNYQILGDPVPGCAKDFKVSYTCPGDMVSVSRTAQVAPEAGLWKTTMLGCE